MRLWLTKKVAAIGQIAHARGVGSIGESIGQAAVARTVIELAVDIRHLSYVRIVGEGAEGIFQAACSVCGRSGDQIPEEVIES